MSTVALLTVVVLAYRRRQLRLRREAAHRDVLWSHRPLSESERIMAVWSRDIARAAAEIGAALAPAMRKMVEAFNAWGLSMRQAISAMQAAAVAADVASADGDDVTER